MAENTVKRTVAGVFVQYRAVEQDLLGNDVITLQTADRGSEIELPEREAQRLEAMGMLAPEGTSREQVVASVVARSTAAGDALRAAMGRALNPADNGGAIGLPIPQPSVSPPSLGAEPVGDFTKGDTGAPDDVPVDAPAADDLRVDAPDPSDTAALAEFIRSEGLTVPQTVALAEGEPDRAGQVLEAERIAAEGEPRAGVVKALEPLSEQGK
jgi:hypothetical protein